MEVQEIIKRKYQEGVEFIDHLKVQVKLGKEEAKEAFEQQKKEIQEWSSDLSRKVEQAKNLSEQEIKEIQSELEELRVQAALGRADTHDAIVEQRAVISKKLDEVHHKLEVIYRDKTNDLGEIVDQLQEGIDRYLTKFDLFRLQFHLGKKEAVEKWNEEKDDFYKELDRLRLKIEQEKEESVEKWGHFKGELQKSWKHMKNAFSDK